MALLDWFHNKGHVDHDIEVGDYVTANNYILASMFWRGKARVESIRLVGGSEGDAIKCIGHVNSYWSKYLKKID